MSHDPLTMYIFHPMLFRPMGMINTNMHARRFSANAEQARPLARIEYCHMLLVGSLREDEDEDEGGGGEEERRRKRIRPTNREYFRRIEIEQRCPSHGIKALEQEHDGDISVYETVGCIGRVVGIHLGKASNDKETDDKQDLRDKGSRLSAPCSSEVRSSKSACKAPDIQHDVLSP